MFVQSSSAVHSARAGPHIELLDFVMHVALRKVLDVGELQVQVGEPHHQAFPRPLEFLPLAGKMLWERSRKDDQTDPQSNININTIFANLK